jgi:hypothetical protein
VVRSDVDPDDAGREQQATERQHDPAEPLRQRRRLRGHRDAA